MLPNLLIIGAPKAGTTSLHFYLQQHPDVGMSEPKELRYFWRDDWGERRAWYESHFNFDTPVRGEATPAYAMSPYRPNVPERAAELIPDAKLIYLVRDPVERTLSHYVQRIHDGDRTSLGEWIRRAHEPANPIVCASLYATQIQAWLKHFDASQLLVLDQHDLKVDRAETMREAFRFLGVDPDVEPRNLEAERNTRADKRRLGPVSSLLWNRGLWPLSRRVPRALRRPVAGPVKRAFFRPLRDEPQLTSEERARLEALFEPEVVWLRDFTARGFASWSL